MEYKKRLIKFSRKQLYDEIWTSSVSGVAKKYDLNYAKLIISCKQANIPFPSSGFWTRKHYGKDISAEIVPLPESNLEYVSVYLNNASMQTSKERAELENSLSNQNSISDIKIDENEEGLYRDILDYLDEAERVMVIAQACSIKIVERARLHPVLAKYKTMMEDYRVRLKEAKSNPYYNPRNKPDGEPAFFPDLSENGAKRTIAILNALYKGIEALGGSINDDLSVTIHKDSVCFRFAESKDKIKHELTKKDIQELAKYEKDLKNGYRWVSMPQIRKYDHVFNGKLRIVFGEKNYLRDNEFQRLEDRLGDILIRFYDKSEENRIKRERREEEQRIREAEQRRKEEICERKNLESQRTKELANKAEDYRIACDIRRFIEDAMKSGKEEFSHEWLAWASLKADWYDPIIAAEDKYLGVREHGKSKEEKEMGDEEIRKGKSIFYGSWY